MVVRLKFRPDKFAPEDKEMTSAAGYPSNRWNNRKSKIPMPSQSPARRGIFKQIELDQIATSARANEHDHPIGFSCAH